MTSIISFKLISQRHQGLDRHALPRPQFQAVQEQELEDLSAGPSAHTASHRASAPSLESILHNSQRPLATEQTSNTHISKPTQVVVLFPIDGMNDQAREITQD